MPMQRHRYPKNWEEIAFKVKDSAGWHCQWCDRPCRKPNESLGDLVDRLEKPWASDFDKPGRFTLTVAHLDHDPENPNARLVALCSVCHCRYDLKQIGRKRRIKAEQLGQLKLNLE